MDGAEAPRQGQFSSRVVLDYAQGRPGLRQMRDIAGELTDLYALDSEDRFHSRTTGGQIGPLYMTEAYTSRLRWARTPRHIARSGLDLYQININLSGATHNQSGRRLTSIGGLDVGILDMARAVETQTELAEGATSSHNLSLLVPRPALAPMLSAPGAIHCALIRGSTVQGRLLAVHILSIQRSGASLSPAEGEKHFRTLLGLVASALGHSSVAEAPVSQARREAMLASVKYHVDKHLDSPALSADSICAQFGLSRASLYRLFEPEGGLVNYIQQHRLQRAFMTLIAPAQRRRRIIDIAVDCHFSSDAAFNRAFRREFGLSPGEARGLANSPASEPRAQHAPAIVLGERSGGEVLRKFAVHQGSSSPSL